MMYKNEVWICDDKPKMVHQVQSTVGSKGWVHPCGFPSSKMSPPSRHRPPRWSPEAALPPTPSPVTSLVMALISAVGHQWPTLCGSTSLCQFTHGRNKHELCPVVSSWSDWAATPWPLTSSYCKPSLLSPQTKPRISSQPRDQLNSPSHEDERAQTTKVRFKDPSPLKMRILGAGKVHE
jgi:hypothetical protein